MVVTVVIVVGVWVVVFVVSVFAVTVFSVVVVGTNLDENGALLIVLAVTANKSSSFVGGSAVVLNGIGLLDGLRIGNVNLILGTSSTVRTGILRSSPPSCSDSPSNRGSV